MSRPSQNDPDNFLVNTIFENYFSELSSKYIKGKLVDIGCGVKPYKGMLCHIVSEHIGVDHKITVHDPSKIDLFCAGTPGTTRASHSGMLSCVKKK